MGFSITSAVFAGIIIICYVPTIIIYQNENHGYKWRYDEEGQQYRVKINPKNGYEEQMAISAALLALGVIEFGIGIWSAICCCVIKCCMATTPSHQASSFENYNYIVLMKKNLICYLIFTMNSKNITVTKEWLYVFLSFVIGN